MFNIGDFVYFDRKIYKKSYLNPGFDELGVIIKARVVNFNSSEKGYNYYKILSNDKKLITVYEKNIKKII